MASGELVAGAAEHTPLQCEQQVGRHPPPPGSGCSTLRDPTEAEHCLDDPALEPTEHPPHASSLSHSLGHGLEEEAREKRVVAVR